MKQKEFERLAYEICLKNYAVNGDGYDGCPPMSLEDFVNVDLSDDEQVNYYATQITNSN